MGGQEYKVRRNPEYERPAKKGGGMTLQRAEAELTYPDGRVVTKQKEVNKAIVEILGLNRNQFLQIAMIAQGDFFKTPVSKSDERKIDLFQIYSGRTSIGRSRKISEENPWKWMSGYRRTTGHLSRRKAGSFRFLKVKNYRWMNLWSVCGNE